MHVQLTLQQQICVQTVKQLTRRQQNIYKQLTWESKQQQQNGNIHLTGQQKIYVYKHLT